MRLLHAPAEHQCRSAEHQGTNYNSRPSVEAKSATQTPPLSSSQPTPSIPPPATAVYSAKDLMYSNQAQERQAER